MSLNQTFFTCMNPWLKCSATWHICGGREYAGDRMVSSFGRAATEMGGAHGPPGQLYREGAGRRGHWTSFFKEEIKKKVKIINMLSLRVELKTSRLLNGCSNQLSYESIYA